MGGLFSHIFFFGLPARLKKFSCWKVPRGGLTLVGSHVVPTCIRLHHSGCLNASASARVN